MAIADFGGSVNGKRIELASPTIGTTPTLGRVSPISGLVITT